MTQLTLQEYLSTNRTPSKVICIDSKTTYHRIPLYQSYLPVCAGMIVHHVEIDPTSQANDVVFVLAPDGMKWGDN